MIRALASRMPAQKAVISPTGPAPMTVMSLISPSAVATGSGRRRMGRHRLAVERVERPFDGARDAGEDRGLAQRVRARFGAAQLLDEVQELARVVRVERDDELLVVEAEGVGGVDLDRAVAPADGDVAAHDAHALVV